MKPRKCTTHRVVVSLEQLLSDSERRIFALKLAIRKGRAEISIHIMWSVVRVREMFASGVELTKREIGFLAKDR